MPSPAVATLKFPAGIDNRSREYELIEGSARTLTNLDVTRAGGLRCRDGIRPVADGDCHSLFAHPNGNYALLVQSGSLCRLAADESLTVITSVAGPVTYAELDGDIFWSDGSSIGRVQADGTVAPWGLATPAVPPLTVVSGGALSAATYHIAMTALHVATGIESGAAEPTAITLTAAENILATAPSASASFKFNFYLTPPNGESGELRRVATVDPGASVTLTTTTPDGQRLQSLHAVKPYPASRLVTYKGRLWGASGSVLWHTSELSPHWLFPATGFLAFESSIRMLGAAEDGIYVGLADRTYYLQGAQPGDMTQRLVSTLGATAGGGEPLPADVFAAQGAFPSRQCAWWDVEGVLCVGKPGGVIVRPNGERYSAGSVTRAASGYRARHGLRQWLSVLRADDPITGPLQAIDPTLIPQPTPDS